MKAVPYLKWFMMALFMMMLIACSSNTNGEQNNEVESDARPTVIDPVTLTIYQNTNASNANEKEFNEQFVQPLQKKYPQISLKQVVRGDMQPDKIVTSGVEIDIIVTNRNFLALLDQHGLVGDMTDLIKQHNMDLNGFPQNTLDTIKAMGNGKLIGLPKAMLFNILYYNKDIFDKFAGKYPTDGITWDDAYRLAQALTRQESGTQYYGFQDVRFKPVLLINQLGLQLLAPSGKPVDYYEAGWVDYFNNFQRFFQIPGNTYISGKTNEVSKLWTQGQLAMMAGQIGLVLREDNFPNGLNWDVAALPSFTKLPQTGTAMDPTMLVLSSVSKHRDAAALAIQALTSQEVAEHSARRGDYPGRNLPNLEQIFGADIPSLKDKNIRAFFHNKPAAPIHASASVINDAWPALQKALDQVMESKQDVVTALRQANEETVKAIEASAK